MLINGQLTAGHARALLAIDDNSLQYELANKVFDEKLSVRETMFIVIAKSVFVFITRGATAFFMSLAGGFLSAVCMLIMLRKTRDFGLVGIGVLSAVCHNIGQLAISFFLVQSSAIIGYAPIMLITAVITGFLTGTVLKITMPYFSKLVSFKEMGK
mgnify:CR=1 FL=1